MSLYRSLIISILSLVVFSCTKQEQGTPLNTFVYNEADGIGSLDPAMAGYRSAIWATGLLFSGLTELDSSLKPRPCLATDWTVDKEGKTWTFTIRSDVFFHSNACFGSTGTRRMTAYDVKYSIERVCNAATGSTGFWLFRDRINGALQYHEESRRGIVNHIEGIRVLNDTVIQFQLTAPFAPFAAVLSMPYAFVVPREAVEHYGNAFGYNPVGTGSFMFHSWKPDIALVVRRNPAYFRRDLQGRSLPYLDSVRVEFMRDRRNEFLEFVAGNFDMVTGVDGSIAPAVFNSDGSLVKTYSYLKLYRRTALSIEYYGMLLDTSAVVGRTSPLAGSKLLRQALNYAVDRNRIATYVLRGQVIPAVHGVLPPGIQGFSQTVVGYNYDPEKARRLLAQAGYPEGKGLQRLILQLGYNERTTAVAEAVQAMWAEIGVNVDLKMVSFPQHLSMVRNGDLALWRTSWIGDYPDPENFMALFVSSNMPPYGPNTTRLSRTDLDSLYTAALDPTIDLETRNGLYNHMEEIVLEEAPWIFLYHDVTLRLTQPTVRGFVHDGSERLILEDVYKVSADLERKKFID